LLGRKENLMKTTLNQKEISEAIGSEVPQTHQVFSRIAT
jgi:hypothetical protein